MAYLAVRGVFQLVYQGQRRVGAKPDGDSVWFRPDNPALLRGIGGRDAKLNGGGFAQLRFEGIDALELHYPSSQHQKAEEAVGARDYLLGTFLRMNVTYAADTDIPRTVTATTPPSRRGYILTRAIDPYQRPVSFVFLGTGPRDGSEVFCDVAMLNTSVNAALMRAGWVYPAYYTHRKNEGGLPVELRDRLTQLANTAYPHGPIWVADRSMTGVQIRGWNDLERVAIWPKLYRRLAAYFNTGRRSIGGFEAWLRSEGKDDELFIVSRAEMGNLHDIFEIRGNTITMLYWPEDLMVVPT